MLRTILKTTTIKPISQPIFRRLQSSSTTDGSFLQMVKQQPKESKSKAKDRKIQNRKNDYSWLPSASSTSHLTHSDVAVNLFFSGYRPLSVKPVSKAKQPAKMYELLMKFESVDEGPLPWVTNATGSVNFDEWNNVPDSVIRRLQPYSPPPLPLSTTKAARPTRQTRQGGRTKPSIRLLRWSKKMGK